MYCIVTNTHAKLYIPDYNLGKPATTELSIPHSSLPRLICTYAQVWCCVVCVVLCGSTLCCVCQCNGVGCKIIMSERINLVVQHKHGVLMINVGVNIYVYVYVYVCMYVDMERRCV